MESQSPRPDLTEPGPTERAISRREAFRAGGTAVAVAGAGLRLASVPLAFAALARPTRAQVMTDVIAVLNFALTLEYLEDEFYRTGLASDVAAALSPAERIAVGQVSKHETAHVAVLQATITNLKGDFIPKPTFDFTAGGLFGDVFSNRDTFLAVAQTFEDTGVRAYKGQAGNVMANDAVLTAALQIHAVEARHASQIRRLRGQKGWITGDSRGDLPPATQATYEGEGNTTHAGVDAAPFGNGVGGTDAVTEAFDEPLTMEAVLVIVDPFIVG